MEFTLLGAAATAAMFLYATLWVTGRRDATVCVRDLWDIALLAAIAGLVVGRLVAMVRGGVNPLSNPGDIVLVRAGVDTVAASLAALVAAAWGARRAPADQLDALAPAALIGVGGWHAGCLFRDACLGTASDLPWAWAQAGSDITRHPVELYAAFVLLAIGLALLTWRTRFPPPWTLAGLALAAAGVARLVTEPMRPVLIGGPVWWYAAAVVVGLAVAGWASFRRRRPGTVGPGEVSSS